MDPVTVLTPIVLELISEFRHRNDEPTEEIIKQRLADKLEHARKAGVQFLASKSVQA